MKNLILFIFILLFSLSSMAQNMSVRDSVKSSNIREGDNDRRYKARDRFGFIFSSGIYTPIGSKHIFAPGPVFGVMLSSPIADELSFDLGFKLRLYNDNNQFVYRAKGVDTMVTSGSAMFFGASLNRLIYDRGYNMIHMRFGLGADFVFTNLSQAPTPPSNNPDTENDYEVTTLHGAYGFSAMHQFKNGKHIGIVTEFHVVPYGLSSRLQTRFDICALSAELFFRF